MKSIIIGKGTLIIKAVEILLENNIKILGVITNDNNISRWCKEKSINTISYCSYNDILQYLKSKTYEYLFSIVNDILLKQDILDTAKYGAINFHDSPLPMYAGANATTWSILEKQKQHAVTWHKVALDYDNGDILEQEFFNIKENETVFSLNAKCFEYAIKTFGDLIYKIQNGSIESKTQDLSKRTYLSRKITRDLKNENLWNAGFISDDMNSEDILALYRALDFKTYENPLAKTKILFNGKVYVINKISLVDYSKRTLDNLDSFAIGEIVEIYQSVVVKTIDGLISIDEILDLCGEKVNNQQFQIGSKVFIDRKIASQIVSFDKLIAKHESYWKTKLENIYYAESPFDLQVNKKGVIIKFEKKEKDTFEVILSKFLLYLSFMQGSSKISVSFQSDDQSCLVDSIYSNFKPINYRVNDNNYILEDIKEVIAEYSEKGTFANDIFMRYDEIKDIRLPKIKVSKNPTKEYYEILINNNCEINIELIYFSNSDNVQLFLNFPRSLEYTMTIKKHFQQILFTELSELTYEKMISLLNDNNIIEQWNSTDKEYNQTDSYIIEFQKIVEEYPNNIAIEYNNDFLTYKELDLMSNRIANYLLSKNVSKGQKIAILFKKNMNMVATILGVLKVGAIYIPMDKKYPKDRIEYMIDDSNTNLIITDAPCNSDLNYLFKKCTVVSLDNELEYINTHFSNELYKQNVYADDIAYIIYTSGTTGRPKGVLVKHKGLNNLKVAQKKLFNFKETERILQYSSFSFDASIWEMSLALNVGATIMLCDSDTVHPGEELSVFLQEKSVTAISLPPSVINTIYHQWDYRNLHTVISGSETCWMKLIQKWKNKVRFFNGYGPTESTVCVSFKEYVEEEATVTIGTPILNTKIIILDDKLKPVPIGKSGEIFIGGAGIAKGYLNQKELTNSKFVSLPNYKSKLYRSGDLARFTPEGDIEFIGRIDNQVKIRGFRIEIDEIDKVALESNLVEMVSCLLNEDAIDKKILLYYTKRNADNVEKDLREFMKQKLPSHMIPAYFIAVDSFPTLPNGKLDKKGLLKIKPVNNKKNVAPRNNTEEILSIIWSDLLNMNNIGVVEDFFEIGGDSLLALQIVASLNEDYRINIPVSAIFENSTIEDLANYINKEDTEPFTPLISLKTTGSNTPIFAVHPGDGNVFCYTDLVRALNENQPFYGLQAYGVEEGTVALHTIEEMATTYIDEIKKVQPKGPYILCGYCAGGTIAFEMAQQLTANGENVDKLILIDARAPHTYSPIDEVQNFINFARNFEGISNRDIFSLYAKKHKIDYTEKEIYNLLAKQDFSLRLQQVWECSLELGVLPKGVGVTYLERLFNVWQGLGGMNHYYVQSYSGEIVLYYAKDDVINKALDLKYLGWEQANPNLEVRLVAGTHFTCIKSPLVETWIEEFLI